MISNLYIKNFAIIDEINIDFKVGLNIFTGETGSGKSIIIEAISLALGNRADTTYIRRGQEKAIVEVVIDNCKKSILRLLSDRDIDVSDNQIIFRRELSLSGRNLCKINNITVPLSFFNAIAKKLVDIHGQYDHQSLLNQEFHIDFIDNYNKNLIHPLKSTVCELFNKYSHLYKELTNLNKNASEIARNIDFMKFELHEIDSANLKLNEDIELKEHIAILQNSEEIFLNLNQSYDMLYERNDAALPILNKVMHQLQSLSEYHKDLEDCSKRFEDAYYILEDISHEISSFKNSFDFSPEALTDSISRLDIIEKLKIKYGNSIKEILLHRDKLKQQLENVENNDEKIHQLKIELEDCKNNLKVACESLSTARKKNATILEKEIQKALSELNFSEAKLSIAFSSHIENLSETGFDKVEFLISTNKGEIPKPLAKIASGGEISRIMLAFKTILGDFDNIPTMIFDEIDTGISGKTASIVGKKLKEISKTHQVFCITHLPQIAAFGTENFMISKKDHRDYTTTTLTKLNKDEKIQEIARMLGGENITSNTLIAAKELTEN